MERKISASSICPKFHSIPHPTLYSTFLLKTSQPIQILLHEPHPWTPLPNLEVHPFPPNSSPNFKATTLLQSLFSLIPKCQSHFPSKALLKVVNFLIPKEGDLIWVILIKGRCPQGSYSKLGARKVGPCKVLTKINDNAYTIQLPPHLSISNAFNVKHLKPYFPAETWGQVSFMEGSMSSHPLP